MTTEPDEIDPFGPDAPPLPPVHLMPSPQWAPMRCCNRAPEPGDALTSAMPNVTCQGASATD